MRFGDTIAAIATPPGRSGRALLRLSGPRARDVLCAMDAPRDAMEKAGGPAAFGVRWRTGAGSLPVLAVCSRAPGSYTGEDTVELLVPGNPSLVRRLLEWALSHDQVRLAEPGEFTARAYLHGRLSLDQAEAVGALIGARTDEELRAAERLRAGDAGRRATAWIDEAATLLALVEAGVDFTDQEDVVPIDAPSLRARAAALAGELELELGESRGLRGEGARVVLAGRPSAGKSTLFNALLGRCRSVVAEAPGTTRDAIEEPLNLPGAGMNGAVMLVDLPGLDERSGTDASGQAQRRARAALAEADVVLYCDPSGRFEEPSFVPARAAAIRVRTKGDLLGGAFNGEGLAVCALDGAGLHALRRAIADAAFGRESHVGSEAAMIPRRRLAMRRAHAALLQTGDAAIGARALTHPELAAHSLRDAVDALGELAGRVHPDDIIGRVFAAFCVGK